MCDETTKCAAEKEAGILYFLWRKAQEHSGAWGMPPKDAALEEREWKTKKEIVMFVEYRGCEYKGTKTKEN